MSARLPMAAVDVLGHGEPGRSQYVVTVHDDVDLQDLCAPEVLSSS